MAAGFGLRVIVCWPLFWTKKIFPSFHLYFLCYAFGLMKVELFPKQSFLKRALFDVGLLPSQGLIIYSDIVCFCVFIQVPWRREALVSHKFSGRLAFIHAARVYWAPMTRHGAGCKSPALWKTGLSVGRCGLSVSARRHHFVVSHVCSEQQFSVLAAPWIPWGVLKTTETYSSPSSILIHSDLICLGGSLGPEGLNCSLDHSNMQPSWWSPLPWSQVGSADTLTIAVY